MATGIEGIQGVAAADSGSGNPVHAPDPSLASYLTPQPGPSKAVKEAPDDIGLVFEVNRDSREIVIKIVDRETHQVIRQIPPEEVQRLRSTMQSILGMLLDRTG